jgi:hypothetical protein
MDKDHMITESSKPCECRICTMTRRRKELGDNPTVEGYKAYCDALLNIWINDTFEQDIEIVRLREKLEGIQSAITTRLAL